MVTKEQRLELARFLDSRAARSLAGLAREELKAFVLLVLESVHQRLGKETSEIDGEDVRALLLEVLPAQLAKADPIAPEVPRILEAFFDYLEEEHIAVHSFERRQALANHGDAFLQAVSENSNKRRAPVEAETFVHGASKLGRNDPCSCGSGKKFKKCHGKNS